MQRPTAILLTLITVLSRLLPHPPNFTALNGGALFAGGKLERPWNYIAPLLALALTDLIIGLHGTMLYVYLSVILVIWLGERLLRRNPSISRLATIGLVSSTLFFLITNFGVWAEGVLYPKTAAGLLQSYLMGLPFWRNMVAADLLFTVGFYTLYAYAQKRSLVAKFDKRLRGYIGK